VQDALVSMRLHRVEYAARDTHLFQWRSVDGKPLPPATAGAHIDIHLPNALIRQYSLISVDAAPTSYTVAVKKDIAGRGGSRALFDDVKVGDVVRIGIPRNNFPLHEVADHTVLIAGGIGITPIRCMARRLFTLGRSWELHYCSRTRDDAAFLNEFAGEANVRLHIDDEKAGQLLDLAAIVRRGPSTGHYYCCGPLPMLRAFEEATATLPPEQVHVEYFTPKEACALTGGYTVELVGSGQTFEIRPGQSILKTLCAAGFNIPFSCEEGTCGACETTVVQGDPDHRDSVLSQAERAGGKTMMICVSGAKGDRLVLDL
jgi:tetrachlorobenzoquinone reductase